MASKTSLSPSAIWPKFGQKVVFLAGHVLVCIDLHGAILELAPKLQMSPRFWSCEHCVNLLRVCSQVHKVSVGA